MLYKKYLLIIIASCVLICSNAHALDKEQINVGILVPINSLYPWGEIILEPMYVMENIFETLTKMKEGSIEIEPCLALRIDPSPDYKIWTAYLRKNVTFHDDTPFNAAAVVASFSVQDSLKNKVKKLDDYTVVFTLDKPNVTFPITLSTPYYGIASQSTIDCYKTNCRTPVIVGTGPYKLQNWHPPSEIILGANEAYWGKKPFFKKAGFFSYEKDEALLEALKKGTVHLAPTIKPKNIAAISEMPHLQFRTIQTLSICTFLLNTERKPFNDSRIRQAINYAINKKELVRKYFLGGQTGIAANTFTPPAILRLYDPSLSKEYDPEKAKALLKEAGYPDGFEVTLAITNNPRPYLPDPIEISNDVSKNLQAVGIKSKVEIIVSPNESGNPFLQGKYEMTISGWLSDSPDPDDYLTSLFATQSIDAANISRYSNKKIDTLLEQGRSQKNPAERLKIYQQVQTILHQEMPFVPLFYSLQTIAWHNKIKNFIPQSINRLYLQPLSLEE